MRVTARDCSAPVRGHDSDTEAEKCAFHGPAVRALRAAIPGSTLLAPPAIAATPGPVSSAAITDRLDALWSTVDEEVSALPIGEGKGSVRHTEIVVEATIKAVDAMCVNFEEVSWKWCGDGDASDSADEPSVTCACAPGPRPFEEFEVAHGVRGGASEDHVFGLSLSALRVVHMGFPHRPFGWDTPIAISRDSLVAKAAGIATENQGAINALRGIPLAELSPQHPAVRVALVTHRNP